MDGSWPLFSRLSHPACPPRRASVKFSC